MVELNKVLYSISFCSIDKVILIHPCAIGTIWNKPMGVLFEIKKLSKGTKQLKVTLKICIILTNIVGDK